MADRDIVSLQGAAMNKIQTIQSLYAAFGRADIATILSYLSDAVDWDNSRVASRECPWNGSFKGKAQVPGFFKAVAEQLDIRVFEPRVFTESSDHVFVELHIESYLRKNGQSLRNDAVHVWTFDDEGRVSAYRHFNDTAAELAAWRL
jgi:uncharacterized protein